VTFSRFGHSQTRNLDIIEYLERKRVNNDLAPESVETVFRAFCFALSSGKSNLSTNFCKQKN